MTKHEKTQNSGIEVENFRIFFERDPARQNFRLQIWKIFLEKIILLECARQKAKIGVRKYDKIHSLRNFWDTSRESFRHDLAFVKKAFGKPTNFYENCEINRDKIAIIFNKISKNFGVKIENQK